MSDLPATSADDAVAMLAGAGSAASPGVAAGTDAAGGTAAAQETVVDRLERGLRKIARQLGL
ncbi:hypothetical protein ARGLB_085_02160 [Arthrobacter globiformis NBRC 12137]|uniref:Uncharacterized protein n=1 Tax=Arthrobacter globiformis (strain ATCC 8010 / DSM 20124 / JCM 1332 / NBRC 12137 / NCIMB 8907 / NRRL B-2979 / 168) TaxID=1077972 RepID=H0QS46_ARTG1|nr:hypothetical protein [Arthrobacter globiformis]GAB15532.1 hypothetical protein ARGLB_085_02160 [Arthrobacter globiformis NBRC 12137]